MGGVLATLIAERIAVRAVIDAEGNLSPGDCTHSAQAAAYALDDFLAHGYATMRAAVYDGGRTDPALRGYHAAMTMASPRAFHHHALELVAMSEPETLVTRLAALRVPVLYIAGVPGGICEHSRALLDRHAVRWVGIEPAGHWSTSTSPIGSPRRSPGSWQRCDLGSWQRVPGSACITTACSKRSAPPSPRSEPDRASGSAISALIAGGRSDRSRQVGHHDDGALAGVAADDVMKRSNQVWPTWWADWRATHEPSSA